MDTKIKRNAQIDILRGLGIILVVLGHTNVGVNGFINLFHVGIFFFIAGFVFKEEYTDSVTDLRIFIIKRIKRLYIPFVLWNVGFLCFRNIFNYVGIYSGSSIGLHDAVCQIGKILLMTAGEQLAGPCWFIRALLVMQVMFGCIDFTCKKVFKRNIWFSRLSIALILLFVGGYLSKKEIILWWDLSTVCSSYILLVTGIAYKKIIEHLSLMNNKKYDIGVVVISIALLISMRLHMGVDIAYNSNHYPNVIIFFFAALCGWIMCWGIADMLAIYTDKIQSILVYIGHRSLSILFMHLTAFKLVTALWILYTGQNGNALAAFLVANTQWWLTYFVAGLTVPLLIDYLFELGKGIFCSKKDKYISAIVVAVIIILLQIPGALNVQNDTDSKQNINNYDAQEMDFSLVYNKTYYLTKNQDVDNSTLIDERSVLEHFLSYGMKEGRIASTEFDVMFYKNGNEDLAQAYGEDYENYFLHYILYGYKENRNVSDKKTADITDRHIYFSRVFDAEYYWEHNEDISRVIDKEDKVALLRHFIDYGMDEGRIASDKFDPSYYKNSNFDLVETYGDDTRAYYIHYILYGYDEGRKGATSTDEVQNIILPSNSYKKAGGNIALSCNLIAEDEILLEYICNEKDLTGSKAVIYEMKPYEYDIVKNVNETEIVLDSNDSITVNIEDINNKFIIRTDNGQYESNYAYVDNPELLDCSVKEILIPQAKSKKGLQVNDDIHDIQNLAPSYTFMNLKVQDIMQESQENAITYSYKGKTYYFNNGAIAFYDNFISSLTRDGVNVCASIISIYKEGFKDIYYADVTQDTGATFYALNTSTKEGYEMVEAFVAFMSSRYNGSSADCGVISKWMVGNEVNDARVYNYMGPLDLTNYVEEYGRTFRLVYNTIKRNNADAMIYVAMEPWWGIPDQEMVYGGKNFIDAFNEVMAEQGNIDWGLAYHAYSFPLCDPKVLNDDESALSDDGKTMTTEAYYTKDSLDTLTITMENINVLTDYFHNEELLNSRGEIRSIILSEQGYTSNSNLYGGCEADQAASLLYAYYKAEANDDIDAFIYFLQKDNNDASLGNQYYQFGLQNEVDGEVHRKLSYSVFQIMDTSESLNELEQFKKILSINQWSDVIPNFDSDKFQNMRQSNNHVLGQKIDISNVSIGDVPAQKYTGMEILPKVTVWHNNEELVNDVDYDVVYNNNIEVGEAKAIIVGIGEYTGIAETGFKIEK